MFSVKSAYVKRPCNSSRKWQPRLHPNGKIYVDRSGHMDTAVYEFEVDSLDTFYTWQRETYADPPPEAIPIIEQLNEAAVEGYKEIYDVIV